MTERPRGPNRLFRRRRKAPRPGNRPGRAHGPQHCSICGAENRTMQTHIEGMSREQHEAGAEASLLALYSATDEFTNGEGHTPLTGDERSQFAEQRRAIVDGTITQPGPFKDMGVLLHIVGSQYLIGDPTGTMLYAHHKKQSLDGSDIEAELDDGWSEWDDEQTEYVAVEQPEPSTEPLSREAAMEAMDEAVVDVVEQEDEAATMAPPTPLSDTQTLRVELLGARLEDNYLWAVFLVGTDYYYGRLDKHQFDPLDLIRGDE